MRGAHVIAEKDVNLGRAKQPLVEFRAGRFTNTSKSLSGQPILVVNAGITDSPRLEQVPVLVTQAMLSNQSISDVGGWETTHRVKVASPITIVGRLVGATYAEFSTSLFDELQRSQRRLGLTRILIKGLIIVLAINLFLYFRVHRPVRALLSAVEAVARGKLLTTVPVRGRDEIGQLAERFNLMVERIRVATDENTQLYEKLRLAHDSLQVKVEEATAELRRKNRELARTNELLSTSQREAARAQRLSAIGQLAATVARQIGTPLTAVSGHLQLLEEDPQLGPEARSRLKIVETQIERQSRIIQDLLIYARKPDPVFLPMDLNACLEECLALLRPEIDRPAVRGCGHRRLLGSEQAALHEDLEIADRCRSLCRGRASVSRPRG